MGNSRERTPRRLPLSGCLRQFELFQLIRLPLQLNAEIGGNVSNAASAALFVFLQRMHGEYVKRVDSLAYL